MVTGYARILQLSDGRREPVDSGGRQKGVALILVLWVIVLLTVMAASFSKSMRRETGIVLNARNRAEAGAVAEAGIYQAVVMLAQADQEKQWRVDGTVYEFTFAGSRVRVRIYDEAGKFDLNRTEEARLITMVESTGLEYEEAVKIVDVILDWRDTDDFKRLNGAEEEEYRGADLSYGPRNKPFQTIEELQLVLGVEPDLYAKLKPMITVYTGLSQLDPSKASRPVLMAFPEMTEDVVDLYLQQRTESAINQEPPPPFPVELQSGASSSARPPGRGRRAGGSRTRPRGGGGGGATYSIVSEALTPGEQRAVIAAVIRVNGGGEQPVEFLELEKKFSGEDSLFNESLAVGAENPDSTGGYGG